MMTVHVGFVVRLIIYLQTQRTKQVQPKIISSYVLSPGVDKPVDLSSGTKLQAIG